MYRNPSLQPVANTDSLADFVDVQWKKINEAIQDDHPYGHLVRQIEERISVRKAMIEDRALEAGFDWQYDLELATFWHHFGLNWSDHAKQRRANYLTSWQQTAERRFGFLRDVSLNGMKTILLIHGGVAIGALGILTQRTTVDKQILFVGKIALGCALVGLTVAGLGQAFLVFREGNINARIMSELSGSPTWLKLNALSRFTKRYGRFSWIANAMIYGSIIWFCLYAVGLYVLLIGITP